MSSGVVLRPVAPADLDAHFAQQHDPRSAAMAAVPARERPAFDAHWAKLLADPTVVLLTIDVGGEVVGSALSFVRDGRREVGYRIAREHWGRGYASAALVKLVAGIDERPLFAVVAVGNAASIRVLEKAGFAAVAEETGDDGVALRVFRLD